MAEIRGNTSPFIRTELPVAREQPVDPGRAVIVLDPRTELERRESDREDRDRDKRADGLPPRRDIADLDDDGGGQGHGQGQGQSGGGGGHGQPGSQNGSGSGSGERREAEQVVFVAGRAVLLGGDTTGANTERAIDPAILSAGYQKGGLDLVAEDGMARMVFNGRLRLSPLSERLDRLEARTLLQSLEAPERSAPAPRPYGPFHLIFDLGPRMVPMIEELDLLRGLTFERARTVMQQALLDGREELFQEMMGELGAAYRFMVEVAECDPDLCFQELKALFADLSTPELARRAPDLARPLGQVDAATWVRAWERLDAEGDTAGRDAISAFSPAQLRFLVSEPNGMIFGPDDRTRVPQSLDQLRNSTVDALRRRVLSAELRSYEDVRIEAMERGLFSRGVPSGVRFAGDASFGAAMYALARSEPEQFRARVLSAQHDEDRDGPLFKTSAGDVRLAELRSFASSQSASPRGFLDRLTSGEAADRAVVDPFAAAIDRALADEGGLRGAPPASIARAVFACPVSIETVDPKSAIPENAAIVLVRGGQREAVAAFGAPSLFGVPVSPEDLARASSDRSTERTEGLTRLANTLERAGAAPGIVDALMALKTRANRPGQADPGLERAVLDHLAAHTALDPQGADRVWVIAAGDGRPRFAAAEPGDALEILRPNPILRPNLSTAGREPAKFGVASA